MRREITLTLCALVLGACGSQPTNTGNDASLDARDASLDTVAPDGNSPADATDTATDVAMDIAMDIAMDAPADAGYPLHQGVVATVFWVGEPASPDNCCIPNDESAWDSHWAQHYGGFDDPDNRSGYAPAAFVPLENAFYFALPYNDFDDNGNCRPDVATAVPWALGHACDPNLSVVKNRWIEVRYQSQVCYAQWEDSGPYFYDDTGYVFGSARPQNETDSTSVTPHAGLDMSPSLRDCLGPTVDGDRVDWRFVEESDVPAGPWRTTITTRQVDWSPSDSDAGNCVCPAECAGQC